MLSSTRARFRYKISEDPLPSPSHQLPLTSQVVSLPTSQRLESSRERNGTWETHVGGQERNQSPPPHPQWSRAPSQAESRETQRDVRICVCTMLHSVRGTARVYNMHVCVLEEKVLLYLLYSCVVTILS
jgi:hypothetical protein